MHSKCLVDPIVSRPFFARLACALAVVLLALTPAVAQKKESKPKAEPYAVVQVDDEVRIVKKSGVKAIRMEIAQGYKRELKAYEAAKKQARKDKVKFAAAKPKKQKFKMLKASCKTEAAAEQFVEALAKKKSPKTRKAAKPRKAPKRK